MEKLQVSLHAQRCLHANQGRFALCLQALPNSLQGVGILEITSRPRHARRLVLMTTSPFGLPLRVDLPTVDPTEWEDEEEDGD